MIDRFPAADWKDAEFPRDLQMVRVLPIAGAVISASLQFCFPAGLQLSHQVKQPETFSFVLTEQDGTRLFGVLLPCCQLQCSFAYERRLVLPVLRRAAAAGETSAAKHSGWRRNEGTGCHQAVLAEMPVSRLALAVLLAILAVHTLCAAALLAASHQQLLFAPGS